MIAGPSSTPDLDTVLLDPFVRVVVPAEHVRDVSEPHDPLPGVLTLLQRRVRIHEEATAVDRRMMHEEKRYALLFVELFPQPAKLVLG